MTAGFSPEAAARLSVCKPTGGLHVVFGKKLRITTNGEIL
jgi:hypothetical protein